VCVTVLGLVIGSARESGPRDRNGAASTPTAAAILARTATAISVARAHCVLQMIVTTPQGVARIIIDDPGQATELVHNRAGGTMSESGVRKVPGPARRYQSRTVNFAAGTWSETELTAGRAAPGAAAIETPYTAVAAQLHHPIGVAGRARPTDARVTRDTIIDGQRAYVLVLSGPGGPSATLWISRSSGLPVQSATPGGSVSYEWTAQRTIRAASLWPSVPAGLTRIPPA